MLPMLPTRKLDDHHNNNNKNSNHNRRSPQQERKSHQVTQQHHHHHHQQQQQQQHLQQSQKRSASMIFRIEQLLPSTTTTTITTATSTEATSLGSVKRLKMDAPTRARGGVYVSQLTLKDTYSVSLPSAALMSTDSSTIHQTTIMCNMTNEGLLNMSPMTMRSIKLSEDVYSYNAIFELHEQQIRVRVVRDIGRDDELVAWYGEELTLLMGIPFLKPLNIQGNNCYTCHMCHLTFETPHPLKIHLALGCGRNVLDILWIRLHYALNATPTLLDSAASTTLSLLPTSSTALPPTHHSPIRAATSSSTPSSISPASSPLPPPPPPPPVPQPQLLASTSRTQVSSRSHQRLSAFKPITAPQIPQIIPPMTTIPITLHSSLPPSTAPPPPLSTTTTTTTAMSFSYLPSALASLPPHLSLLPPVSSNSNMNAAAQIEAIVSNMGASKQGHLCIYCGKVYSRKYGLKIHIRTHTGFKPLKCKFCLRPFGDPSNLNKHVRLHLQTNLGSNNTGTAPAEGHQCHLCHKILVRRRDLQRHIETRHSHNPDNDPEIIVVETEQPKSSS